jgi:hypothetical protein
LRAAASWRSRSPRWIVRPDREAVHLAGERAAGAQGAEPGELSTLDRPGGNSVIGRAGDRAGVEIDDELALGEPAARRAWQPGLAARVDPGLLHRVQQRPWSHTRCRHTPGAARRRPSSRRSRRSRRRAARPQRPRQRRSPQSRRSPRSPRCRVDRDVPLVPVKPARGGLGPVPASGSTVELTLSFATLLAIRNRPSSNANAALQALIADYQPSYRPRRCPDG